MLTTNQGDQFIGDGSAFQLYLGDCLEKMALIPEGSVDMVMADLPYG
jgi:DNA modification methylase